MIKRLLSVVLVCIGTGMLLIIGKSEPVSARDKKQDEAYVTDTYMKWQKARGAAGDETLQENREAAADEALQEAREAAAEEALQEARETAAEEALQEARETAADEALKETQVPAADEALQNAQMPAEKEAAQVTGAAQPEVAVASEELQDEYIDLAIAKVERYVNVRKEPNTESTILGKMYDGSVAWVRSTAGEAGDWLQIVSGNVEGYIKAEYFICGEEAQQELENHVTRYVQVHADRLNVRKEPDIQSKKIGYLNNGERAKLLENCGDWCRILYANEKEGYVSAEYVVVCEEYSYAKTLEEERAELKAKQQALERLKTTEIKASEPISYNAPDTEYSSTTELREKIIEYAMQYLGNVYVNGGTSLESGTDCSGFTCFIYKDFGYSISRTPSGQYKSDGMSIDYSEIQKGDIVCYSSNGSTCTHVALYIGDGQIIHAANSRKGVIIGKADYSPIIAVKNIIDVY